MRISRPYLRVGDEVKIWIVGVAGTFTAVVLQVDPPRLRVTGDDPWPILREEDFVLRRSEYC